ncbi:choice-of-anchor B family protein [Wenzhouxiangella marina]|uniref:Regulator n=1 Tax=Wenzhouxiangella marina TaxID=1579979 RepID=A0A0K0XRX0_9GAMM|nr:choice-of-anchor B family protein [Wenzhouxiangella marina]AKS40400.1 regulator [Wenzhouxiangella marina]MBB6088278.1 choice-of-anchor B domain-containing protein [Wenzhouxiangella marina]
MPLNLLHNKFGVALVTSLLSLPLVAWACFTADRAEVLAVEHPDLDFASLAHQMHMQQTIDYRFNGPRDCVEGFADQFPCQGIGLAGWVELPAIGGGTGSDNWGWRDPDSGRLFALMGRSNGVAFVEVTVPESPVYLGNLPRPAGVSNSVWTDIKTYGHHAFIVADSVMGQGMQVFDLRNLLASEERPPQTFAAVTRYDQFNSAHNIAINTESGFAYTVGGDTCAGGLHMIDVRDPENPSFAGCFASEGYTHDVQCVIYRGPDERYQGNEICFASNETSLDVVDVTDKEAPRLIGRHSYPQFRYTHQGWLTEDHRYFFLDDELDETTYNLPGTRTLVFDFAQLDVSDPPAEYIADGPAIDHNQYVIGDYVFQANYKRGLRVLHIKDPATANLEEVAWFDTYPNEDGNGFSGAWNVFPFFANNLLLVSDFNRGLFIVRVSDPNLAMALESIYGDRFAP